MDVIKGVLIFVFLIITLSVSAEEDHSDEHHDDAFENILKTLKLNNSSGLRFQNLTTLLTKLGVHDCSNKTNHHHKCVTASSLFGFYNISTADILNETDFGEIATVIIYTLLRNEEHSDEEHSEEEHSDKDHSDEEHSDEEPDEHGTKFVTQKVDVYKELLKRYQTSGLCEQILDQMLRDVNESIGKQLDASKCFSMHEVFHDQNISTEAEINKEIFSHISTIIVSKLLDGHCIELEHKTPLPCPSFFVGKLFEKYASNDVVNKEKIEELLKNLKIAGKHESSNDKKETDHDHDHRSRRSLPVNTIALTTNLKAERLGTGRYRREAADDHHDDDNHAKSKYEKCYSADQLFAIYHADQKTGFKIEKFKSLSSALLYEIDSSVCVSGTHDEHSDDDELADKYVWGYSIVAVAIISLCSVVGVAFIPFMKKLLYQKAIIFFIALAVGTLTGDALLHLMPHATGFHDTDSHNHGGSDSSGEEEDRSYLWKFLVAVAGIYSFFLFESITHLFLRKSFGHSRSVEHTRGHNQFANGHHLDNRPDVGAESNVQNGNLPVGLMNVAVLGESGSTGKIEKPSSSMHVLNIEEKTVVKKTIASMAWMIIIGDTIHNIADGIAIGVAFTDSTFGGISTSIAVFCHELPHELGDFAVLLSAGMSVKSALLANFLSACSCFIGLVFGILIGEIKDVNLWIFALTAGFFLYIALTDMLPELMHSSEFSGVAKTSIFFLQNAGMLTGFGIMILLAYYEEDIRI